jgi:hypothetical protein
MNEIIGTYSTTLVKLQSRRRILIKFRAAHYKGKLPLGLGYRQLTSDSECLWIAHGTCLGIPGGRGMVYRHY